MQLFQWSVDDDVDIAGCKRSFDIAASAIWNTLPHDLSSPSTCKGQFRRVEPTFSNKPIQRLRSLCIRLKWTATWRVLVSAVDGGWSRWGAWSECSTSCGHEGVRRRQRHCDNPLPQYDGRPCGGDTVETAACPQTVQCPGI